MDNPDKTRSARDDTRAKQIPTKVSIALPTQHSFDQSAIMQHVSSVMDRSDGMRVDEGGQMNTFAAVKRQPCARHAARRIFSMKSST